MTRYGIDRTDQVRTVLGGRRIGLATNPTGLDSDFRRTVSILQDISNLACLFGPEHGVYGDAQAGEAVADSRDPRTGLPVHSLYGERREPSPDILAGLDALVFDMQDVGLRWYTYPWTLSYLMQACARSGLPLVVLDRPNPLGGAVAEGLGMADDCRSFIGRFPLPARHGLTIGELARHLARRHIPGVDLTVSPCAGWNPAGYWPDTGLAWVPPSPNLPTFDSVTAYAALAFLEGTTLSEGRGTTRPFETFGAPWLDNETLVHELEALDLPGLRWRPVHFVPAFSKFAGLPCRGVALHFRPGAALCQARPWAAGMQVHHLLKALHPAEYRPLPPWKEGSQPPLALLTGQHRLLGETTAADILGQAQADCSAWLIERQADLLYDRSAKAVEKNDDN